MNRVCRQFKLSLENKLIDVEKDILEYILNNDVSNKNMSDVAAECYTSATTINRIIKKWGYSSFTSFKAVYDINVAYSLKEVQKFMDFLGSEFYITNGPYSEASGKYLFNQLKLLGYKVVYVENPMEFDFPKCSKLLVISYRGEIEIVKYLEKEKDVRVAAITKKHSNLDNTSDLSITHQASYLDKAPHQMVQQKEMFQLIDSICNQVELLSE